MHSTLTSWLLYKLFRARQRCHEVKVLDDETQQTEVGFNGALGCSVGFSGNIIVDAATASSTTNTANLIHLSFWGFNMWYRRDSPRVAGTGELHA